ncbi:hypothetical protein [Nocardia terpenica]|uniref:Secreted protein n=1 Tax=Nocardia terpenica TaxID=455432 RepID=A0A6G9ZC18_9NOCA|nr:hypothetical protein [Nocardia terpenica]QIS22696.1 hypothetical protein F6W96_34480 [Nocardia terpenica]
MTVVVGALATAFVVAVAAGTLRDGADVVGHRTAPRVAATDDLSFALADMDAQVANVLLAGGDSALSAVHDAALQGYQQRRAQADADLQQAISVAGTDDVAQRTIRTLLDQLGDYEARVANVVLLNDSEKGPAGRPAPDVLDQYRRATALMGTMLGSAGQLGDANTRVLEGSYASTRHDVSVDEVWLGVCAVVLLGSLVGLQVLLRVTMRRRLNPALLAATVVAVAVVVGGFVTDSAAADQLRVARHDAFDSLQALQGARAISTDANADESRYLLDPQRADVYQQAFLSKSLQLADVHVTGINDYDAALARAVDAYRADRNTIRFGGRFGDELHNITFPGEREAAVATVTAYQAYQRDDRVLRDRARTDLRQAIQFDTSPASGNSDGDFTAYDKQLATLIDINQRSFDTAIGRAESTLAGWSNWLPYTAFGIIAVLCLLGVRPRLAEYR